MLLLILYPFFDPTVSKIKAETRVIWVSQLYPFFYLESTAHKTAMFCGLSLEQPDAWDVLGSPIWCFLFETAQKKVAYLGSCVFERGCVGLPVGLPNKARNTQKGSFPGPFQSGWEDENHATGNESREINGTQGGPENLDALHPVFSGWIALKSRISTLEISPPKN